MHGQSGSGLPDFRDLVHVLRATPGHLRSLLEDLPDGTEAYPEAARDARPERTEVREHQQQQSGVEELPHQAQVSAHEALPEQEVFRGRGAGLVAGHDGGPVHDHDGRG